MRWKAVGKGKKVGLCLCFRVLVNSLKHIAFSSAIEQSCGGIIYDGTESSWILRDSAAL